MVQAFAVAGEGVVRSFWRRWKRLSLKEDHHQPQKRTASSDNPLTKNGTISEKKVEPPWIPLF